MTRRLDTRLREAEEAIVPSSRDVMLWAGGKTRDEIVAEITRMKSDGHLTQSDRLHLIKWRESRREIEPPVCG